MVISTIKTDTEDIMALDVVQSLLYSYNMKQGNCKVCKKRVKRYGYKPIKYCSLKCRYSDTHKTVHACKTCLSSFSCFPYRKKAKFCSVNCYAKHRRANVKVRIRVSPKLKKEVLGLYNHKCAFCKNVSHTQDVPLCIHHIDDNPLNTTIENLAPLCVSCHRKSQRNIVTKKDIYKHLTKN